MTSKSSQATSRAAKVADPQSPAERTRQWLLAGFAAVCVARPLVPSEGVSWLGDGHAFTMLLLLLAGGSMFVVWQRGRFSRRFQITDAMVAALVFFCVASALLGVMMFVFGRSENPELRGRMPAPRLALNMTWEWIGLGLTYFLARQLPTSRLDARVLVTIFICLASAISVLGLYQVAVTLPAERAVYAENPDEVLKSLGQWFPEGSPERERFEARLASTEPLATFALTNSLAGLLAAWLIVAGGVVWCFFLQTRGEVFGGAKLIRTGILIAALGAMIVCLALTKSRSAYLALLVGMVGLPLVVTSLGRSIQWKWVAAAGGGASLVVVGLLFSGAARPLVDEAARSLQFRFEYWEATLDMIAEYPLVGVGPGEFQDYYTSFKLPQASEEVRDPHNFVLEVWATGGTLAFLALVGVLVGFGLAVYEARRGTQEPEEGPLTKDAVWLPLAGAVVGLPLAYAVGLPFGFLFSPAQAAITLVVGGLVGIALGPWLLRGRLPVSLAALGAGVLMVHWLASGGFTYPGVAGTFWVLVALTVNEASDRHVAASNAQTSDVAKKRRWRPRWVAAGGMVVALAAIVACYLTAFLPVMTSRAALARAANEQLSPEVRYDFMVQAARADLTSAEPLREMARLSAEQVLEDPSNPRWPQDLVRAVQGIMIVNGHSSAGMREMSHLFRDLYRFHRQPEIAKRMVELSRVAATFYPNSAVLQGEYAEALAEVGNKQAARRVAQKALELDELTPHADKKMPPELRLRMQELVSDEGEA